MPQMYLRDSEASSCSMPFSPRTKTVRLSAGRGRSREM